MVKPPLEPLPEYAVWKPDPDTLDSGGPIPRHVQISALTSVAEAVGPSVPSDLRGINAERRAILQQHFRI